VSNEISRQKLIRHLRTANSPFRQALLVFYRVWVLNEHVKGFLSRIPVLSFGIENINRLYSAHETQRLLVDENDYPEKGISREIPDFISNLVVGSGPGVATLVIGNFDDFLVFEKGQSARTPTNQKHSITNMYLDFDGGGQELCISRPLTPFAQGSLIGGGSEINSGLYHDLPDEKVELWSQLCSGTAVEWKRAEARTHELLHIGTPPLPNDYHSTIRNGSEALDLDFQMVRRWRKYDEYYSFEHFGASKIVWQRYPENIRTGIEVLKIRKRHSDYEVQYKDLNSGVKSSIRCKKVFLGAGTVGTPRILLKSKMISRRQIKFNLHPMVRVLAKSEADKELFDIDPFQSWSKDRNFKFGGAVSTPSLLAISLNNIVKKGSKLHSYYVSFIPSGKGGLFPLIKIPYFRYSREDRENMRRGKTQLIKLLHSDNCEIVNNTNKINLSTVHIFGSLPLGSPFYLEGTTKLLKYPGISVWDASILPTAPGVNPQGPLTTLVQLLKEKNAF